VLDVREIGAKIKNRLFSPGQAEVAGAREPLDNYVSRNDRRRSLRIELEMLVTATRANGERFEGYCRNLSRDGAAALVWGELEVGEQVQLTYRPLGTDSEEVVVPARVRQAIGYRYGFEFAVENESELSWLLVESCRVACTCPA
jgi:PilZ domain-containing protein